MLEGSPEDAFCLYGVAQEHAKAGRHEEALGWFDRSIAADPAGAYAFYHKARSLQAMSREGEAVHTLRQGLKAAQVAGDSHAASEIVGFLTELGEDP